MIYLSTVSRRRYIVRIFKDGYRFSFPSFMRGGERTRRCNTCVRARVRPRPCNILGRPPGLRLLKSSRCICRRKRHNVIKLSRRTRRRRQRQRRRCHARFSGDRVLLALAHFVLIDIPNKHTWQLGQGGFARQIASEENPMSGKISLSLP